jgi:hypothetical protein
MASPLRSCSVAQSVIAAGRRPTRCLLGATCRAFRLGRTRILMLGFGYARRHNGRSADDVARRRGSTRHRVSGVRGRRAASWTLVILRRHHRGRERPALRHRGPDPSRPMGHERRSRRRRQALTPAADQFNSVSGPCSKTRRPELNRAEASDILRQERTSTELRRRRSNRCPQAGAEGEGQRKMACRDQPPSGGSRADTHR